MKGSPSRDVIAECSARIDNLVFGIRILKKIKKKTDRKEGKKKMDSGSMGFAGQLKPDPFYYGSDLCNP